MARKEIPFISGWREPDITGLIYEFCENMYPILYQGNGGDTTAMLPAPGNQRLYKIRQAINNTSNRTIRGMIAMNGYLWVVIDTYLIKLTPEIRGGNLIDFAENVYSGIVGGNTPVRMAYSNNYELGIVDGTYIYSYSSENDTLVNATNYVNTYPDKSLTIPYHAVDIGFISNRFVVTMDYGNTFFVSYDVPGADSTVSEQYGRRLTIPTTTVGAVVTTRWVFGSTGLADDTQGIALNNGNFYLFGRYNTQIWTDAGLASLPFQRITGGTYNYGASSTYTIDSAVDAQGNDITVFLSQDKHGALSCVVLGRGGAQKISNKQVEGFWSTNVTDPYSAIGFFYRDNEDLFYQLTFPEGGASGAGYTFVYDFEMNEWHRRIWTDGGRHKANCFSYFNTPQASYGFNIFGDFESAWLYSYSGSLYSYEDSLTTAYSAKSLLNGVELPADTNVDNTDISTKATTTYFSSLKIPKVCVSPIFDNPEGRTMTVSMLEVEYISGEGRGDVNTDLYTEDTDPMIKLRVSHDRGRTYTEPFDGTSGIEGNFKKKVIYYGLGSSHDGFVFKLQSYSKQPIIILKMIAEFQVGAN